jgi:hypothetical protein
MRRRKGGPKADGDPNRSDKEEEARTCVKTASCPKTAPSEAKRRERQKKYFAGAYFISK